MTCDANQQPQKTKKRKNKIKIENKRKMPKSFCFFALENGEAFSKLGVLLGFSSTSLHDSLWARVMGLDPNYLISSLRAPHCVFCTSSVVFCVDFDHFFFFFSCCLAKCFSFIYLLIRGVRRMAA
jgi:hypothetical protein